MAFEKVNITRQQAAREEIDTAIELMFEGGSAVAADLLSWAAVEMMRGIAEHRSLDTFQRRMEERVRPEHLREWREIQKGHYNYFKHADRDPERTADGFMPEATSYTLFGACIDYDVIFGRQTLAMMSFVSWFLTRHPNYLRPQYSEIYAPFAAQLDDPAAKPFRESLATVADLYRIAKRNPTIVKQMLENMGPRYQP